MIYPCPHCQQVNRLPEIFAEKAANTVCGACKKALFPSQAVIATDADFADRVMAAPLPVLVDFWAPWCAPCRAIAPALEQLAREYAGQLIVAKLNVDENPHTASRYAVRSIPTMMLIRHGHIEDTVVGALPSSALQQKVNQWLG